MRDRPDGFTFPVQEPTMLPAFNTSNAVTVLVFSLLAGVGWTTGVQLVNAIFGLRR